MCYDRDDYTEWMRNILPLINVSGVFSPLFALRSDGDCGIGDIHSAYYFIDWLFKNDQFVWQILPINETSTESYNNPYSPISAFAFDPIYADLYNIPDFPAPQKFVGGSKDYVEYDTVRRIKTTVFEEAFKTFYASELTLRTNRAKEFEDFCNLQHLWLQDYTLFKVLCDIYGDDMLIWPEDIKKRKAKVLKQFSLQHSEEIKYYSYVQWIMHIQWGKLQEYAKSKHISIIGDVPMYMSYKSADVWAHPEMFQVDEQLNPKVYGGSPPDGFNDQGQIWKLAVYNWKALRENNYSWWLDRLEKTSEYCDAIRLDHFRGFIEYWSVKTQPSEGKWRKGPGRLMLNIIAKDIADEKLKGIYAEDLGVITLAVENARMEAGFQGYVVFNFHYKEILSRSVSEYNCAQTCTHDIPPLQLWWRNLEKEEKKHILEKLGIVPVDEEILELQEHTRWSIIETLFAFPFRSVIIPLRDIIGSDKLINNAYTIVGNWRYRSEMSIEDLMNDEKINSLLRNLTYAHGRNRYFANYFIRSSPAIRVATKRTYTIGEQVTIWALSETKEPVEAVTNLPIKDQTEDVKTIPLQCFEKQPIGTLYKFTYRTWQEGEYFLTLKVGERYISEYKNDMRISIVKKN